MASAADTEAHQERHEYSAALRVLSTTLRLADLKAQLGEPTRSHDIGDLVSPRIKNDNRRKRSYWGLQPEGNRKRPMDELISDLLDFVEGRSDAFDQLRPSCDIDLFCGIFSADAQGGFVLEPELMRRASALDLTVGFDIY